METIRKLLAAGNGDSALLYLSRMASLGDTATCFSDARLACAASHLAQLGLNDEAKKEARMPRKDANEPPNTDTAKSSIFKSFVGEVRRCLGRDLSNVELEILVSLHTKLGFSVDVLNVLVHYCVEQNRTRDDQVMIGMHAIEKEAYRWADQKIDTLEKAAEFIQADRKDLSRRREILRSMGITGRRITEKETQYIQAWCDMGFPNESILLAFQKTCENTGGLTWKYMSGILERWHNSGLHTVQQIQECDHKPTKELYKRKNGYIKHDDPPTPGMIEAVRQMLEDQEF